MTRRKPGRKLRSGNKKRGNKGLARSNKAIKFEQRAWTQSPDGRLRGRAMKPWSEMVEHGQIKPDKGKRQFMRATGGGKEVRR